MMLCTNCGNTTQFKANQWMLFDGGGELLDTLSEITLSDYVCYDCGAMDITLEDNE